MPLTRDFKETIRERVRSDPGFRAALLEETVKEFLSGDVATAKAVLRDYVHATVGFEALGRATKKSPKSLMRMLGPDGNPQASNLFAIFRFLQIKGKIRLEVTAKRTK